MAIVRCGITSISIPPQTPAILGELVALRVGVRDNKVRHTVMIIIIRSISHLTQCRYK
jgi:hypothetical protein